MVPLTFGRRLMSCAASCLLVTVAIAAPVEVLNKGIGGNSTRDGLRRYARDVEGNHPDHLVLYFGMNDALNSGKLVPPEEFQKNLQAMIDRARAAEVKTILLVTPNPIVAHYVEKRHPKHPQESFAPWLAKYDQIVRDLASTNQLPLVDLGKRVLELQPELEGKDSLIRNLANSKSADGVHLTAAGYKIMAELVADTLGDAVQPGQRVVCFGDSITFGAHMKGAGTATGETYPAWLWLTLNRKLGQTDATEPPSAAK